MRSHTRRLGNTGPKRSWAQPSRWAVLTGFTLLPLLIGQLPLAATINEWQLVVATAVGAAVGGILLALAWAASRSNHPLLDVLPARGYAHDRPMDDLGRADGHDECPMGR